MEIQEHELVGMVIQEATDLVKSIVDSDCRRRASMNKDIAVVSFGRAFISHTKIKHSNA